MLSGEGSESRPPLPVLVDIGKQAALTSSWRHRDTNGHHHLKRNTTSTLFGATAADARHRHRKPTLPTAVQPCVVRFTRRTANGSTQLPLSDVARIFRLNQIGRENGKRHQLVSANGRILTSALVHGSGWDG